MMPLRLLCLPLRTARCGARLGFALGLGVGLTLAAGAAALAAAAQNLRPLPEKRAPGWRKPSPVD